MRTRLRVALASAIVACTTSFALVTTVTVDASPAWAQSAPTTVAPAGGGAVVVNPTSTGFPGGAMVQNLINWAGQFALWGSVVSLLIGAGIWGVSQQFGNGLQSGKGKTLAAAGAVGAVLTGLAAVIVNTLFTAARG